MSNNTDREIERKYLLRELPAATAGAPSVEIDQGYIPGERINERIRRMRGCDGDRYYRTIKAGAGVDRLEIEEETTELFFSTIWPLTRGRRVRKRRYFIQEGESTWEIDEFLDRDGLWLAELELDSAEQVVVPPIWLRDSVVREVTDDPAYTNHSLAR